MGKKLRGRGSNVETRRATGPSTEPVKLMWARRHRFSPPAPATCERQAPPRAAAETWRLCPCSGIVLVSAIPPRPACRTIPAALLAVNSWVPDFEPRRPLAGLYARRVLRLPVCIRQESRPEYRQVDGVEAIDDLVSWHCSERVTDELNWCVTCDQSDNRQMRVDLQGSPAFA